MKCSLIRTVSTYTGCCELDDATLPTLGDGVGGASGNTRVLGTYLYDFLQQQRQDRESV